MKLVGIFIAPAAGVPMVAVEAVRAVPGKGLEGDRYFKKIGTYSGKLGPDRECTLVEVEALEAAAREQGVVLAPEEVRRNLAVRGVPLDELVGRELAIGDVRLLGIRACEPCGYLSKLTGGECMRALTGRGGLRARVLTEGWLRVGDGIRL